MAWLQAFSCAVIRIESALVIFRCLQKAKRFGFSPVHTNSYRTNFSSLDPIPTGGYALPGCAIKLLLTSLGSLGTQNSGVQINISYLDGYI